MAHTVGKGHLSSASWEARFLFLFTENADVDRLKPMWFVSMNESVASDWPFSATWRGLRALIGPVVYFRIPAIYKVGLHSMATTIII